MSGQIAGISTKPVDWRREMSGILGQGRRAGRMPVLDTITIVWAAGTCEYDIYAGNIVVLDLELTVHGRCVGIDFIPGDIPLEVLPGRTALREW